jgi:activator of HSP90 ATPase
MGSNMALYTNDLAVQKWRMSDWPVDHYSTVKYKLTPYIINGIEVKMAGKELMVTDWDVRGVYSY